MGPRSTGLAEKMHEPPWQLPLAIFAWSFLSSWGVETGAGAPKQDIM